MYKKVRKRETAEFFIAIYMYSWSYCIHVSRFADPRLTARAYYGIMPPVSDALRPICSYRFLIELYYNSDFNLKKVLIALQPSVEVNRNEFRK